MKREDSKKIHPHSSFEITFHLPILLLQTECAPCVRNWTLWTKTYYKRTSGKHMKAKPKKEEWESFNRNKVLEIYI
jgi:hypothetical protein